MSFSNHYSDYATAREDYRRYRLQATQFDEEIDNAKGRLKALEADVVSNGGLGEAQIDGSNEAKRAAQLTSILATYPAYQATLATLRDVERKKSICLIDADDCANRMSLARRAMDHAIQEIALEAATEANLGVERKELSHVR